MNEFTSYLRLIWRAALTPDALLTPEEAAEALPGSLEDPQGWLEENVAPADVVNGGAVFRWGDVLAATVLPFIDLAVEVLEAAVLNVGEPESAIAPSKTSYTTEELLAQPEHVNPDAYEVLAQALWPQELPYDHPADQVRETLRSMGLSWASLIEACRSGSAPTDAQIAALGMGSSSGALDVLLDVTPASPHELWGYESTTLSHPHPEHGDTEAWHVVLRWVPEVLARGAVEHLEDLRDVIHTRYVQGSEEPFQLLAATADTCDPDDLYLGDIHADGVTPAVLPGAADFTRLQAFLRLRRLTGYSALELDKVLHALSVVTTSNTGITAAHIVSLDAVGQLQRQTGRSLTELCSWWSEQLDTFEERPGKARPQRPLYDQLFLDPSRGDPTTSPFALNEGRTELLTTSTNNLLEEHEAELVAALRTTPSELARAAQLVLIDLGTGDHLERKLDHLSRLFRKISIAQTAKLPVHQAFLWASATVEDPEAGPGAALNYFEQLAEFSRLGLDATVTLWVLSRDPASQASAELPDEDELQGMLGRLRTELRSLAAEAEAVVADAEPTAELLRQELLKVVTDVSALDALVAILSGDGAGTGDEQEATVETHLGHIVDVSAVRTEVIDGASGTPLAWSLEHIRERLLAIYQRQRVEEALGSFLSLELGHVRQLCVLPFDALSDASLLSVLTHSDFVAVDAPQDSADPWGDLTRASSAAAYHALDLALSCAWLIRALGVSDTRLSLWLSQTSAQNLLSLSSLPVEEAPSAPATSFPKLRRTALWLSLLSSLSEDESGDGLLSGGQLATLFAALASRGAGTVSSATALLHHFSLHTVVFGPPIDRTVSPQSVTVNTTTILATSGGGWASDDAALIALRDAVAADAVVGGAAGADQLVSAVCLDAGGVVTNGSAASGNPATALRLSLASKRVADLSSATSSSSRVSLLVPASLEIWWRALSLTVRTGVSADELLGWAVHEPTQSVADSVRAAARARYTNLSSWSSGFRPVRDAIRKRQQEALVSWLLARHPTANTLAELHDEYLIDAAMDPCALTSRLVQATASVQLFVQRCFLGLEEGLSLGEADAEQWRWMKQYRLWEAARKVFLYPENWLAPELRITKSELFEAAESQLLEEDPTPQRVSRIAARYLEQLHTLSNPEVVAVWQEVLSEGDDIVHLIAQTQHQPPKTYYRRYEHDAYWTPWENLSFDVASKSVALVVANQRTLLVWLDFHQMSDSSGTTTENYAQIQVMWAERLGGEWSPVRQGPTLSSLGLVERDATLRRRYHLGVEVDEVDKTVLLRIMHRIHSYETADETGWTELGVYELGLSSGVVVFTESSEVLTYELDPAWPFGYSYQGYVLKSGAGEVLELPVASVSGDVLTSALQFPLMTRARRELRFRLPPISTFVAEYPPFVAQDDRRGFLLRADGLLTSYEAQLEELLQEEAPSGTTGKEGLSKKSASFTDADFVLHGASLPVLEDVTDSSPEPWWAGGLFRVTSFHLPFVDELLEQLRTSGLSALYRPDESAPHQDLAVQGMNTPLSFLPYVNPLKSGGRLLAIKLPVPYDHISFDSRDGGAFYHWEFFYHLPMLVSRHLREHGRYEEALDWLHLIFDPRRASQTWAVRPLSEPPEAAIDNWAAFVDNPRAAAPFASQVAAWLANPFDPHLVASMRPEAYQRATLMAYLDVLMAWGDARFAEDTRESTGEALQLYLYAQHILGEKPQRIEETTQAVTKTYDDLREDFDAFGNALIAIEELLPEIPGQIRVSPSWQPLGEVGYFCVPVNDILVGYHQQLEDRLYKLRHCMNLQGVVRQLPLFQPPIDPGAIISALAAGADLGSALDVRPRLPSRRFVAVLQHAKELAGSTRALGSALLSALEKRDGETLSLLRQRHELVMSDAISAVREAQLEEAELSLSVAEESRSLTEQRRNYYQGLLDKPILPEEAEEESLLEFARLMERSIEGFEMMSALMFAIPQFIAAVSPGTEFGGQHLGQINKVQADLARQQVTDMRFEASTAGRAAGRIRREMDWAFQRDIAEKELSQHELQIAAARVRVQIAERELSNHALQRKHSESVYEQIVSKFTNRELQAWMAAELSRMYSASYQLSLEVARQAEAAYRHEIGVATSSFVRWTNWEGLRKGLLAGERLTRDLEQMEVAYHNNDIRERELTKHVSLAQVDPYALLQLRQTKSCEFTVHEVFFDLDFPGQYFRRLKSVSVTVPCVTGPYGGVNATLTLVSSHTRTEATAASYPVADNDYGADERFRSVLLAESVSLSSGQGDSGLFSADMRDAKYLPFERRGAISRWKLSIDAALDSFDPDSITDVVLHVQYTAREGGSTLKTAVNTGIQAAMDALVSAYAPPLEGRQRVVSLKREMPDAWHAFLHPPDVTPVPLVLSLDLRLFPRQVRGLTVTITQVTVGVIATPAGVSGIGEMELVPLRINGGSENNADFLESASSDPYHLAATYAAEEIELSGAGSAELSLSFSSSHIEASGLGLVDFSAFDPDRVSDVVLIVHYTVPA